MAFPRNLACIFAFSAVTAAAQTVSPPTPPVVPSASESAPLAKPIGPARISGGVMAGLLLTRKNPVYPPEAKAKGISGTVVLHAIIGKDGTVEKLAAISGPDLLKQASLDAISQWIYKPYLLNGEPTEVDTTITVNFNTNTQPPDAGTNSQGTGGRHLVSGSFMGGYLISAKPPVVPAIARTMHVSGSVVLRVIIGKDGSVKEAQAISGPDMLRQSAVDAVKQSKYRPYLLNGEPTEVESTVTVNFQPSR